MVDSPRNASLVGLEERRHMRVTIEVSHEDLGHLENAIEQCITLADSKHDNFDNRPTVFTLQDLFKQIWRGLK